MCFSNAKTYSLDFRGITLSGANGGNDDSSQPFGSTSVGSNSTNLDTGFGSSRRGGAPATAGNNKRTRVSFLLYWVRQWRESGATKLPWELSDVSEDPKCPQSLFPVLSPSPSNTTRYNQNQNVIIKQLPGTFLNQIKSGPNFAVQSRKITNKARWAGRGWLCSALLLCSNNIFNARLLSPEQMTRPININRRKGKERSDFWQQKGNGSLQAMLSPKMLVSWPWSWFTF